ncbi:hypothetical protein G9A89_001911 [Geosiphon pyriformis]|nr:hypothetical protein G9A89_001911 [Geosiphon pyriformis]
MLRKKFDETANSTLKSSNTTNIPVLPHQQLINTKSAFNFYVNKKIAYLLGTLVNTELVRETFYHELIQNTSLPTNHNFAFIITKINKEIEHHTQQRYPITYLKLLDPYGKYFEGFQLQTPIPLGIRSPPSPPDFGIADSSLCSSILQCIHPIHPADLQAAVTNARDFEAAELKANHAQAVNLVINESSELDSKLKQFSDSINQKLERNISTKLHTYNAATNLLAANLLANSIYHLSPTAPTHLLAAASGNLPTATNSNTAAELISKQNSKAKTNTAKLEINSSTGSTQNLNSQHYLSLLVTPEDTTSHNSESNRQPVLTSNIPPATVTNDKTLATIFSFKLEETTMVPLFSKAALKKKPITIMYTDVKVDDHSIKLILDSRSVDSIITRQFMDQLATKTPIGEINNFPIEVNSIIISIKVLVMEATQYQVLVVPVTCSHFKPNHIPVPLINLEEEKPKPTWKAY